MRPSVTALGMVERCGVQTETSKILNGFLSKVTALLFIVWKDSCS